MLSVDFVSKRLLSSACFSPNFGWPSNKHPTNKVLIQAPNHSHLRFHCYFILRGLGTGSRMAVLHQQSPAGAPCLKSTDLKRAKRVASPLFSFSFSSFSLRYSDFPCPKSVQEDSWGEILSVYRTCHLELSFFFCQACHVTLLFQVKIENSPLLFCLLISHFLSSVSIKPMTTMLVFLRGVCGDGVGGCLCTCVRVCV